MSGSPFPYMLIYTIEESEIIVLAVAHQHRKPNYWKNRRGAPL